MSIAHLAAAVPLHLPPTLVLASHQPAVRQKVPHLRETRNLVDLVQQYQPQDRPDPRHASQQSKGHRVIDLRAPDQPALQPGHLLLVGIDQRQVGSDAVPRAGMLETLGEVLGAIGRLNWLLVLTMWAMSWAR